jgi:catechol 2,3-dioxygenase
MGWPLEGAADHGVSEALYLRDPEGNGIEVYRDRPDNEWPRQGERIAMVTGPLDLRALAEAAPGPAPLPAGTRLGHIHLHVADLSASGGFYRERLGLQVTQSDYPGALFLSLGGYHHHVGLNTWTSRRAPEQATGLISFRWECEGEHEEMRDPDGTRVRFEPPRGLTR